MPDNQKIKPGTVVAAAGVVAALAIAGSLKSGFSGPGAIANTTIVVGVGGSGGGQAMPLEPPLPSGPLRIPDKPIGKRGWKPEQIRNAAIIVDIGREMKMPKRALIIAVATAMQESSLTNHGHLGANNDHDSLGLFQQRPSQGWGTPKQIMDPRYAARKFYEKLMKVKRWWELPLTKAAQAVQVSAYPNRYADDEEDAKLIVNELLGLPQ